MGEIIPVLMADPSESRFNPIRVKKWIVLFTAAISLFGAQGPSGAKTSEKIPVDPVHVLLITVDTLRADHLSCYGYGRKTSPNVDEFAEENLLFRRFYAQNSRTLPSLSTIFTGFFPHETTVMDNTYALPPSLTTLTEILKDAGYVTGAVVSNYVLRRETGFNQGFDTYDDHMEDQEWVRKQPERVAERTTQAAMEWLDKNKDKKFFLWVHYQDPHGPYTPRPPYHETFLRDGKGKAKQLDFNATTSGQGGIPDYQRLHDHRDYGYYVAQYDGEIRYFDHHFGVLMEHIKGLGLYDHAMILFASDHGEGMGEQDVYFAHDEYLNRGLIHVPLIIRFEEKRGIRNEQIQQTDLATTLLETLGIPKPPDWRGQNLLSDDLANELIFSEHPDFLSVIGGDHNLFYDRQKKEYTLYDLEKDPDQTQNLIHEERFEYLIGLLKMRMHELEKEKFIYLEPVKIEIDEETGEKLRSLGYVQ